MRCGFCNLFTTTRTDPDRHDRYLSALARQIEVARAALPGARVATAAIGGGTPTLLSAPDLVRLFDAIEGGFGVDLSDPATPLGVETSPATATPDRLAVLEARGVSRISIGVQSFVEAEANAAGRPQQTQEVDRALRAIHDARFQTFNLDLMYGLPGQTPASFRHSLDRALAYAPEELFLYPLYVRPGTGLVRVDRPGRAWSDRARFDADRMRLYCVGRDHLRERGYVQRSMRLFRRAAAPAPTTAYRCQEDGMVGLGAGARSYTRGLHWSSEWGVGRPRVEGIIDAYVGRSANEHAIIDHGIRLSPTEQRRRHLVQSILFADGLSFGFYRDRFGASPLDDWPELQRLADWGLATIAGEGDDRAMILTEAGLARSDAIGPWLVSDEVRAAMSAYVLR